MKKLTLWALLWIVLCGFTIQPYQGTFTATFTEPTTNSDASALTNLSYCNVYVLVPGQSAVKSANITASAATGGGVQTPSVPIVWGPVPSRALSLQFWVTCTNTSGLESSASPITTLAVDPYPLRLVP